MASEVHRQDATHPGEGEEPPSSWAPGQRPNSDKENDQSLGQRKAVEAPLPTTNPWTKKSVVASGASRVPYGGREHSDLPCATKIVRAGKPSAKKASDFNDITNWPTPGETAGHVCQPSFSNQTPTITLKQDKVPSKPVRKNNQDSKENHEAKVEVVSPVHGEETAKRKCKLLSPYSLFHKTPPGFRERWLENRIF
ncbi:la-related protein 1-like [Gastrophryne carolinensis]